MTDATTPTASREPRAGLTNTSTRYGTVTKTFHWLTALLIVGVMTTGIIAHNLPPADPASLDWKIRLYSIHKTIGLTIFFTALLRILWAISQPKPALIATEKKAQAFLAEVIHYTLYASLVLVPLTGWMTHAATEGFAPIKWPFGQELPFIPNDPELAERFATAHKFFERVMVASLLLHIAGALKHHFVDKDATLRRMWFGQGFTLPKLTPTAHTATPAISALVIFAAVGTAAALQPVGRGALDTPALEDVASDWRVLDGQIEISVEQFGAVVTGTFADWTAAIDFDPNAEGDTKGSADVTIAIGSLTLGSVTNDALSADFFNVDAFPTATVTGDIVAVDDAYELRGSITIKGSEVPLTLPFDLTLEGDVADASGAVELQRLDFNVGESMPTGSDVGLAVGVSINLTATTAVEAPSS
ncbi:MAG: cytochrome b/b6 domain-containing protein [Pseudomonadota bacterium]